MGYEDGSRRKKTMKRCAIWVVYELPRLETILGTQHRSKPAMRG